MCESNTFLIGRHAQAYPYLVRREIAEGHTVGHHSWSHPTITLRGLSTAAALRQITRGIDADQKAAYGLPRDSSIRVPFFRFPGFADTPTLLTWLDKHNFAVFGADFWASDWDRMTPAKELHLVMRRLHKAGRGIILFHYTYERTARMLPLFLRELRTEGYRVVQIVPRPAKPPPLEHAPKGWTSETQAILSRTMPRVLRRARAEAGKQTSVRRRLN